MRQNTSPKIVPGEPSPRVASAKDAVHSRRPDEAVLEDACAIDQRALWSTRRIRGFIVTQRSGAQRMR